MGLSHSEFAASFGVPGLRFWRRLCLADAPGFSDTWKFPVAMTNNQGISNNYSDSGSTPILYNGNMCYYFWFAKKYNLPQLGALRLQMMDDGVDIYGASFPDLLYYDPVFETTPVEDLPLDMSFLGEDVQGVAMRENYTDMEGAYVAYHAVGELGQDHGHLDAGTYVLDMAGFRVAVDLGADDYNLPGFFDYPGARNHFYRVRPEGHNLFVINPDSEFFWSAIRGAFQRQSRNAGQQAAGSYFCSGSQRSLCAKGGQSP